MRRPKKDYTTYKIWMDRLSYSVATNDIETELPEWLREEFSDWSNEGETWVERIGAIKAGKPIIDWAEENTVLLTEYNHEYEMVVSFRNIHASSGTGKMVSDYIHVATLLFSNDADTVKFKLQMGDDYKMTPSEVDLLDD